MQIQKTVFLSYRRANTPIAILVYKYLKSQGFDVFYDVETMDSGDFSKNIPIQIAARAHFVLILTPSALERCVSPDDWLRIEIEEAMRLKRNIVPLFFEKFEFNELITPYLKGDLMPLLPKYNGLEIPWGYLDEGLDRLINRFLNKAIDSIEHPIPKQAQAEAKAAEARIEKQEAPSINSLKAQEHYEHGFKLYKQSKYRNAIDEFGKAIALDGSLAKAYNYRGVLYYHLRKYDEALADYNKAIELNPDETDSYGNRGNLYSEQKNYTKALADYDKVIELNPNYANAYYNRALLYTEQECYEEAIADFRKAISLDSKGKDYQSDLKRIERLLKFKK